MLKALSEPWVSQHRGPVETFKALYHHRQTEQLRGSCKMSALRLLLSVLLLSLSCANAQNVTASTLPANLTVTVQLATNFTNASSPPFPCNGRPRPAGGYRALELIDERLSHIVGDIFKYFAASTVNVTDCEAFQRPVFNLSRACSQVSIPQDLLTVLAQLPAGNSRVYNLYFLYRL